MDNRWSQAQAWESSWWDTCVNTFNEEQKQQVYAREMGLFFEPGPNSNYIMKGNLSVLDIGGGPVSLLLKTITSGYKKVIDPALYPTWVEDRYRIAGIDYQRLPAEKIDERGYDEVWMYNVLEHTHDPNLCIENTIKAGKTIRVFEWINAATNLGHPHTLRGEYLNKKFGVEGTVKTFTGENNLYGEAWIAIIERGQ